MAILTEELAISVPTWTVWSMKDRKSRRSIARHRPPWVHPDAVFYQGDLADQDFMRRVFKEHADIDAVTTLRPTHWSVESMADPLKYFDNNTAGMVKLLKSCMNVGCTSIVFSSTAATYGFQKKFRLETTPQNRSILMGKASS